MFRSGLKELMLHRANDLARGRGIALAISMTCSTGLVVEVYLSTWPAVLIAAAVVLLCTWLWFVRPLLTLQRNRGRTADS